MENGNFEVANSHLNTCRDRVSVMRLVKIAGTLRYVYRMGTFASRGCRAESRVQLLDLLSQVSVIYSTDSIKCDRCWRFTPRQSCNGYLFPQGKARCCFMGTRKLAPALQIMINKPPNGNHCTF